MDYLVIDLEMCRVKKLYRKTYKYASEIIQIGAVLLDEGFNRTATMCEYVNPEYGVLDNFIESMTGIKNRDIKQAPKLTEALEHLSASEPENTRFMPGVILTERRYCMR